MADEYSMDTVSIRLVKDAPIVSDKALDTPEKVVRKLGEMMSEFDREVVGVVNLKSDLTPINVHFASMGAVNESIAHPREIFKAAVLSNASSIMLLHNHPSGNITPSKSDTMLTDRMNQACELMGIPLTDHIIVGGDNKQFFSFREKGMIEANKLSFHTDYRKLDVGTHSADMQVAEDMKVNERYVPKKENAVKEITQQLEKGLSELFESDKFKDYLKCMSKFHNYSFNNTLLIAMQKPDATLVAGFASWKNQFKRHVKKGEKGIKILAPANYKKKGEQEVIDPKTMEPVRNKDGSIKTEEVEVSYTRFFPVTVFDVSQTDGEPISDIGISELSGSVDDYKRLMSAIEQVSPVPILMEPIEGGAKGYFSPGEQKIVIQENMSESQTVKTAVHELAHSLLHDKENVRIEGIEDAKDKKRSTKEVEAEAVAYTVCNYFGLDTSDYSFGYVAGWSDGKDTKELKASMETIRTTADFIITNVEDMLKEITLLEEIDRKEPEIVQTDKVQEDAAYTLACKLDAFAKEVDPYGYGDSAEDSSIEMVAIDIRNEEADYLVAYLTEIITEDQALEEEIITAKELLAELKEQIPSLAVPDFESHEDVIEKYKAKTMEVFHELDGENAESIEKMVKAKAESIFETMNLDCQVLDVVLVGSRSRGIEQEDSDVEVVVAVNGDVPAEEVDGLLNGENIRVDGHTVFMHSIVNDVPMKLEDFLMRQEAELSNQKMEIVETTNKAEQKEDEHAKGMYGNFKMAKAEQSNHYYLIADVKYPSGEIERNKPIAEFPNLKEAKAFCKKNQISPEDVTKSLSTIIQHKKQITNEKEDKESPKSKAKGNAIDDD